MPPKRIEDDAAFDCPPPKAIRVRKVLKRSQDESPESAPCAPRKRQAQKGSQVVTSIEPPHAQPLPMRSSQTAQIETPQHKQSPAMANAKPCLALEEQIKRASTLAAQLRDGVKHGADSKNSAADQIAIDELMRHL